MDGLLVLIVSLLVFGGAIAIGVWVSRAIHCGRYPGCCCKVDECFDRDFQRRLKRFGSESSDHPDHTHRLGFESVSPSMMYYTTDPAMQAIAAGMLFSSIRDHQHDQALAEIEATEPSRLDTPTPPPIDSGEPPTEHVRTSSYELDSGFNSSDF